MNFIPAPIPPSFGVNSRRGFFGAIIFARLDLGLRQDTHKSQHSSLSISAHACMQVCWCVFSVQASGREHGPKPEDAFLIYRGGGRQRPVDHCECARTRARFNFKKCGAQKSAATQNPRCARRSRAPSSGCSSTLLRALRRYCVTVRRERRHDVTCQTRAS